MSKHATPAELAQCLRAAVMEAGTDGSYCCACPGARPLVTLRPLADDTVGLVAIHRPPCTLATALTKSLSTYGLTPAQPPDEREAL